eukprot:TRINITY_DN32286_c0_g1_i1.p1 TRINITY_DN32286_c0_g1~~TRINITY_DN32286_c0_g1_i1.p1  ORF type:complete len:537 (-),score=70.24 TRINITY_DN32286_c0_g1_i1:58-1614(-)
MSHRIKCSELLIDEKPKEPEKKVVESKPNAFLVFAAHWFGAARFDQEQTGISAIKDNTVGSMFVRRTERRRSNRKSIRNSVSSLNSESHHSPSKESVYSEDKPLSDTASGSGSDNGEPKDKNKLKSAMSGLKSKVGGPISGQIGGIIKRLDADGDGVFDVEDLDELFANDTDGLAVEDQVQQYPIFTVLQSAVVFILWLVFAIMKTDSKDPLLVRQGGLEDIFKGWTEAAYYSDCKDLRWEAWRWLTYQFTHGGLSHVGMNIFMLTVAGIPLEGFQGSARTFVLFNAGVITGATVNMVWNPREALIGMSAGCYALFFVHISEILLNWRENRYRWLKIFLLVTIMGIDYANIHYTQKHSVPDNEYLQAVSHAAHGGGAVAGVFLGIIIGRNLKVSWQERALQAGGVILLLSFWGYTAAYLQDFPPQTKFDPQPWCWSRQIFNVSHFGNLKYHCVLCADLDCVKRWSIHEYITSVNYLKCPSMGGFWKDPVPTTTASGIINATAMAATTRTTTRRIPTPR